MQLDQFIQNFIDQFEDLDANTITPQTVFKDLDEWSSLSALSIIAMADEEYNVMLKGEDIRNAVTVEDLFNIVKSKQQD